MFETYQSPKELRPSDPRFGVGPSLIPLEFIDSLKAQGVHYLGTSHRKSAVKNVVKEIQEGLRTYFRLPQDYSVVLGNGGATFLFDMLALGMVQKRATHFVCGEFSEKWFKSSKKVPWIETVAQQVPFGEGITPTDDTASDLIACTLNETSTGVIVDQFPKVHDGALLAVDATSGAAQVPCDVSKVDVFFFSPQKVFASDGGLWVAILSPKARERALTLAKDKSRYIPDIMSWESAITNSDQNQTYNTPALATLWFLNEQVKKMNKIGYDAVIEDDHKKTKLVYGQTKKKSYLSPYIKDPKYHSNSVAAIDVDDKVNVDDLLKALAKEKSVYNIDGYRKLGRNQFRIGLFHNIAYSDLEKLTKILSHAIESVL